MMSENRASNLYCVSSDRYGKKTRNFCDGIQSFYRKNSWYLDYLIYYFSPRFRSNAERDAGCFSARRILLINSKVS